MPLAVAPPLATHLSDFCEREEKFLGRGDEVLLRKVKLRGYSTEYSTGTVLVVLVVTVWHGRQY